MAVIKEYNCPLHGHFESRFSVCPHGCVDVERVFTRAPATVSRRTRNIDRTLEGMAKDHNLSDISNRNGTLAASVSQFQPRALPDVNPQLTGAYLEKQKQLFGGNIERGADGSFWASGMSWQTGTAKLSGDMKTILGYDRPQIQPTSIVQGSYGTSADLMAAAGKK